MLRKNKRGSLQDPLVIIIFIFMFGLTTIISLFILDKIEEGTEGKLDSDEAAYAMNQGQVTLLNFDKLFLFILIGLIVATIIGAYMIETNPILFWISFILLLIFLFVTAILSNVFEEITTGTELESTAANYTIINMVMEHLGLLMVIIFALTAIALFAKWRSD